MVTIPQLDEASLEALYEIILLSEEPKLKLDAIKTYLQWKSQSETNTPPQSAIIEVRLPSADDHPV